MPGPQVCATVIVLNVFVFIKSTTGLDESATSQTAIMNSPIEDEVT